ncbi:unnamed protein product [Nesidiocoris tenuis]|uniref:Eclosion hormone n=1 Tax=Nesidiocoris tenuis TaxID=355587 RepID=A0A6H5HT06_9HEMI|nr:unnamed protein product [Nesidiocoris tenuis]
MIKLCLNFTCQIMEVLCVIYAPLVFFLHIFIHHLFLIRPQLVGFFGDFSSNLGGFDVVSAVSDVRTMPTLIFSANTVGVCIRNCAQCKKMFGAYFQGELCADTCLKFKGKLIPDCEDVTSIGPFLNKLE